MTWKNQHEYTQNSQILRKSGLIWLQFQESGARNIYLAKVGGERKKYPSANPATYNSFLPMTVTRIKIQEVESVLVKNEHRIYVTYGN